MTTQIRMLARGTILAALDEERLEALQAARACMVKDRHDLAQSLARPYEQGRTDGWMDRFIRVQSCIEAIDRAIKDEERHRPGLGVVPLA